MGSKLMFISNKNYIENEENGKVKKSVDGLATSIYIYDSTDIETPIQSISNNINSIENLEGAAYMNTSMDKIFFTKTF